MVSCDIYMKAHVQIAKHFSHEASDLVGFMIWSWEKGHHLV